MNLKRVRPLKQGSIKNSPVIYWMSRDQRVNDNWALIFGQNIAIENKQPLIVVFCLATDFPGAAIRHYSFMLDGLKKVEQDLQKFNISFLLLNGDPGDEIPGFLKNIGAGALVTDFDPLKIKRKWKTDAAEKITVPFFEVDAHNIIPCFHVSQKEEFGAYTIRPKIHKLLPEFLEEFPPLKKMRNSYQTENFENHWNNAEKNLNIDYSVTKITSVLPGENSALIVLEHFLLNKITNYNTERNDPVKDSQSNLSPYLHFGQLSAQRIALNVERSNISIETKQVYLEELIVRRELADNFCLYNLNYDNFAGFQPWAKKL